MLKIVKSIFNTGKRPEVFSKEKINADDKALFYHLPEVFSKEKINADDKALFYHLPEVFCRSC
jgi:hypothetical protein